MANYRVIEVRNFNNKKIWSKFRDEMKSRDVNFQYRAKNPLNTDFFLPWEKLGISDWSQDGFQN